MLIRMAVFGCVCSRGGGGSNEQKRPASKVANKTGARRGRRCDTD